MDEQTWRGRHGGRLGFIEPMMRLGWTRRRAKRGGSACLDSAPLVLSGFLPGLSNAGPCDFVAAEGGRSPTAAATKSWRGYAAATNACTPK